MRRGRIWQALAGMSRVTWPRWERFASSRAGAGVMFAWAVAEATFLPVVPDFILAPMAAGNRRRPYVTLAASVLGSAAGGTALFLFAFYAPDQAADALARLPLVPDAQIEKAGRLIDGHGVPAFLLQPWSGVPFKVWAVHAGGERLAPWFVIPTFVLARALRMTLVAIVARALAQRFRYSLDALFIPVLVVYGTLFFLGLWWIQ